MSKKLYSGYMELWNHQNRHSCCQLALAALSGAMYSIKFVHDSEVRRAQVQLDNGNGILSFEAAAATAKSLFNIVSPFKFLWSDEEGNCSSLVFEYTAIS